MIPRRSAWQCWSKGKFGWRNELEADFKFLDFGKTYNFSQFNFEGVYRERAPFAGKAGVPDPEVLRIVRKFYPDFEYGLTHEYRVPGSLEAANGINRMENKPILKAISKEEAAFVRYEIKNLLDGAPTRRASLEDIEAKLLRTSPGFFWSEGYATKKDCAGPAIYSAMKMLEHDDPSEFVPLIQVVAKSEILPRAKIDAQRARVYGIVPVDWIVLELYFCLYLKEFLATTGIGMGMSLQYGGLVDAFAKLRQEEQCIMGDWSGHDVNLPAEVDYLVRDSVHDILKLEGKESRWFTHIWSSLTACAMLFPNGGVYSRNNGNMSGCALTSFRATMGNLVQHLIVFHRACYRVHPDRLDATFGLYDVILEWKKVVYFMFGDDHIEGGPKDPVLNLYFSEDFRKSEFLLVGAKLKDGSYTYGERTTNHLTFLGYGVYDDSSIHFGDNDKLLCSLVTKNSVPLEEKLNGLILNAPYDLRMQGCIRSVAKEKDISLPTSVEIRTLWTGFLPESKDALRLKRLHDQWMERHLAWSPSA